MRASGLSTGGVGTSEHHSGIDVCRADRKARVDQQQIVLVPFHASGQTLRAIERKMRSPEKVRSSLHCMIISVAPAGCDQKRISRRRSSRV